MPFAVYLVEARPGKGWPRAYVGVVDVELWGGGDPKTAVEARAAVHMAGGKSSAAWLRETSLPRAVKLDDADSRQEGCRRELFWTLATMRAHGRFLTRGGPFCRVALPWPFVDELLDLCPAGTSYSLFWQRLEARLALLELVSHSSLDVWVDPKIYFEVFAGSETRSGQRA